MTDFARYVASRPLDKTLQAMAARMEKLERVAEAARAHVEPPDLARDPMTTELVDGTPCFILVVSQAAHGNMRTALAALDDDRRG